MSLAISSPDCFETPANASTPSSIACQEPAPNPAPMAAPRTGIGINS